MPGSDLLLSTFNSGIAMTPIGYSRTQLTSTIALSAPCHRPTSGMARARAVGPRYPLDWLWPIPRAFTRIHCPEVLELLVLRMRAALLNPVQVEMRGGYRRVQVLQTTVIEFGRESGLCAYAWETGPGSRLVLEPRPLSYVSAGGSGHESRWRSGFAQGFWNDLRRHYYQLHQLSHVEAKLLAFVLWVIERVQSHLTETVPMEPVHAAIERALLCDPEIPDRLYGRLGLNVHALSRARVLAQFTGDLSSDIPSLKDYQECLPCLQNNA